MQAANPAPLTGCPSLCLCVSQPCTTATAPPPPTPLPRHLSSLHVSLQLATPNSCNMQKLKRCLIFAPFVFLTFLYPPLFDECHWSQAFWTLSFLLCSFQSVAARQEMCWCNASIMSLRYVLLTLSAGNCGDIDLGWERGGQNLCYLLILSFQHSILFIVQNKELLQKAVCC